MRDMYDYQNTRCPEPDRCRPEKYLKDEEPCPDIPLATAYIRNQPYVGLVPLDEGFQRGSMFPNLYQPHHYNRRCSR